MPILLILIVYAGIKTIISEDTQIETQININFFTSAIIYASYNLLPLLPILIPLKNEIKSKNQITKITLTTFISIVIPAISIFTITCTQNMNSSEIILIEVAKQWGPISSMIFSLAILSAIYTSAICSGYGFAHNVAKTKKQYITTALIMCILTIPISMLNFSTTIQTVYPIFGLLGLIQIYHIITCMTGWIK